MFTKPLYSTVFTGETADRLFSNVTASGCLDSSFFSTIRILLRERLPKNMSARIVCKSVHFSETDILSVTTAQAMGWFVPGDVQCPMPAENTIIIVFPLSSGAGAKMLEIVKANSGDGKRYLSGYTLCEDLRIFYARKVNALFYHSETDRTTVIFADKLELKQFHALQMMLPKYMPALFKNAPLTEVETALLKSLGDKSAVEYERILEKFAKSIDMRAEIIRTKLAGFETVFERMRLDEIRNDIEN